MSDEFEKRREEAYRRMDEMAKRRPEPYTGETIVMPERGKRTEAAEQPEAKARPARPQRARPQGRAARRAARPWSWVRVWRWARLALVLVLLLVGVAVLGLYWQARQLAQVIGQPDAREGAPLAMPMLGGVNLLLIGVDEREGAPEEGVRSDTLIVAHLNGPGGYANLLSIPRDTVVEVGLPEGPLPFKINTAYGTGYARAEELYGAGTTPQQGGMALAAQTTQRFLGTPIHYTAQINFDGFARLIDALGGITIDVPVYIFDDAYPTPDFGYTTIEFQPGVQRMDGATALIYARTRHSDSDFGRAQRQQQVMRAMIDEFRGRSRLQQALLLPKLRDALGGTVTTTLPVERLDVLLGLFQLSRLDPAQLGQFRISPESVPSYQEVGSDLYWDAEGVRELVRLVTSPPSEAREAATVQVFNGTGTAGLAGRISNRLAEARFSLIPPGDAPPGDYPLTRVYDRSGKPLTAQRLARELQAELSDEPLPEGLASDADLVVLLGADAVE
jgi:polyisoprenyl-teichoic acid--peptidoglycan teichoic acid transferase